MKKTFITMLMLTLFLLLSFNNHSQAIGLGSVIPTGSFTDDLDGEWGYELGKAFYLPVDIKSPSGLILSLAFVKGWNSPQDNYTNADGNKVSIVDGDLGYWSLSTNLGYSFKNSSPLEPYISAGGGFHYLSYSMKLEDSDYNIDSSSNSFGFNLGLGAEFEVRDNLVVVGEGRYHLIDAKDYDGDLLNLMLDLKFAF